MNQEDNPTRDHYTTLEVAGLLGMAVRSVQLMVDREELEAWKTPGGHRRISRTSVERWIASRRPGNTQGDRAYTDQSRPHGLQGGTRLLLIEDSTHFQNLVSMLVRQHFPSVELRVADDGIAGLATYGQFQPDILIVDILLPGIDGPTLITSLRSHPQFARSQLIVITSLDESQRAPYAFALKGVRVIHKPRLVAELPSLLAQLLPESSHALKSVI
ncbi:response regulator [Curvibacter sp. RS43]|uniref:response regulator n=1 Tax=Curvibacter microcysteis TaxID=3026419 RepID=UPI00235DCF88|nr:response regulator [Curvibacter sp. RS43]MDD0809381.1 response regulator [Curvibacter sp. RS43]